MTLVLFLFIGFFYIHLDTIWALPFAGNGGKGKGIIFAMGPMYAHFMGVWATIHVLRNELRSKLPIEVWMYDFEWPLLPRDVQSSLTSLSDRDVSVHFLTPLVKSELMGQKGSSVYSDYVHFSTKPRALLESKLDEVYLSRLNPNRACHIILEACPHPHLPPFLKIQVILLDCDALIFLSPEDLFSLAPYTATGTLFLRDKPVQWWPANYPSRDPGWMGRYLGGGYAPMAHMRSVLPIHDANVDPPLSQGGHTSSQYAPCSSSNGEEVCSPHRQESSLLLFDKRRQRRSSAILWDMSTNTTISMEVYSNIYGDKESYWMACELAGAPHSFSPWAPSHWSPLNATDDTCPDKVIEPHIAHYMPSASDATPTLLSVNQLKVRAMRMSGGGSRRNRNRGTRTGAVLALSPRIAVADMHHQLSAALASPERCPAYIADFRRVQRCWSRHLKCTGMKANEMSLMRAHATLQSSAKVIFQRGMQRDREAEEYVRARAA